MPKPKKPLRPSEGDLVRIVFWDHAENARDALKFEVIGRLFDSTKIAYKIRCWGYVEDVDRAGDDNTANECSYAIVKKAVESIEILS